METLLSQDPLGCLITIWASFTQICPTQGCTRDRRILIITLITLLLLIIVDYLIKLALKNKLYYFFYHIISIWNMVNFLFFFKLGIHLIITLTFQQCTSERQRWKMITTRKEKRNTREDTKEDNTVMKKIMRKAMREEKTNHTVKISFNLFFYFSLNHSLKF